MRFGRQFKMVLALFGVVCLDVAVGATSGTVTPGIPPGWGNDFCAATNLAHTTGRPLVLYWGNLGCGNCDELTWRLHDAEAVAWVRERSSSYIFCYVRGSNGKDDPKNPGALMFAATAGGKRASLSKFPFVCLYRVKSSGDLQAKSFSGLKGYTPVNAGNLRDSVIASVDDYFAAYLAGDKFAFSVGDTETDRYEAEPSTKWVDVKLLRTDGTSHASVCDLVAYTGGVSCTNTVKWAEGQTEAVTRVSLTPFVHKPGNKISLTVYDSHKERQAKTYVHMVSTVENGPVNPDLKGAVLGKWSMDLDAVTNLVAQTEGANTLVFFTGALWCPHCRPLEAQIFETDDFRSWAASNRLGLALLDNPRRSAADSYAEALKNGYADLSAVPDGPGPTLLRTDLGSNNASGASYVSRKMVTESVAETILRRNHELGYAGGLFCAPSGYRTGYPTVILLDRQGRIRARWQRCESSDNQYDLGENMSRLRRLLALAETGTPENGFAATTSLEHAVGGCETAELVVSQNVRAYRLSGLGAGTFSVEQTNSVATAVPTFSLVRVKTMPLRFREGKTLVRTVDYPAEEVVASGSGHLAAVLSAADTNLVLKVSCYDAAATTLYGDVDTTVGIGFKTRLVLTPTDAGASVVSSGHPIFATVSAGKTYHLEGASVSEGPLVDKGNGFYLASGDGEVRLDADVGANVRLRTWNPGKISFADTAVTCYVQDGEGVVRLVREQGSTGEAHVLVTAGGTASATNRYDWADTPVVFGDGESEAEVRFQIFDCAEDKSEISFTLSLVSEDEGDFAAAVSAKTCSVNILATTEPSFDNVSYAPLFWKGFANRQTFPLRNVGTGLVTLKKKSGTLPAGVTLTVDGDTAVLAGVPTATGTYTFSYQVREVRDGKTVSGPVSDFRLKVGTPGKNNPYVGKALPTRLLPMFALTDDGTHEVLAGTLSVAATSDNRLSAKYIGTESSTISYVGQWQTLDRDNGSLVAAQIVKGSSVLDLELSSDGRLSARLELKKKGYSYFAEVGDVLTGESSEEAAGGFSVFKGKYVVHLPDRDDEPGQDLTGTGFLQLKMTSSSAVSQGKVTFAGRLPDGKSVSGSAALALFDAKNARLPVFVRTDTSVLGVYANVKRGVATAWRYPDQLERQQLVLSPADVWSYHLLRAEDREVLTTLDVYGGAYESATPAELCELFGYKTACRLSFDASLLAPSSRGEIVSLPSAKATATATSFKLTGKKGGAVTLAYDSATGVFSGTAEVTFADGKVYEGKYYGQLLPGWTACGGCGMDELTRPFGSGTLRFADKVDGRTVYRSLPVKLTAEGIAE